jgi:hypothetical protein
MLFNRVSRVLRGVVTNTRVEYRYVFRELLSSSDRFCEEDMMIEGRLFGKQDKP